MDDTTPRSLPKSASPFMRGATLQPIVMKAVEGQDVGRVEVKPLMIGNEVLMLEFVQEAGVRIPEHVHADHESIVYLIRGRMELKIGEDTFIAQAGDVWMHEVGVPHSSVALEDCAAVEVKSPPRRTWNSD